jgi:hypothetical protein
VANTEGAVKDAAVNTVDAGKDLATNLYNRGKTAFGNIEAAGRYLKKSAYAAATQPIRKTISQAPRVFPTLLNKR